MAIVTYNDQDAVKIEWFGIRFIDGVPVEVNDEEALTFIRNNRFFEVLEDAPQAPSPALENEPKKSGK